jgi:hypothetical protein
MADEPEDIDLDQIVWDPRYRRRVIERLNGVAGESLPPLDEAPRSTPGPASRPR